MWQNRLTASIWILLGLIALTHCVPLEVVYTGDACDCPTYLDTQIHIPRCPKQKKYIPHDYGYKVDVPVQTKTKVSYSFDFTVEEPRTPRPYKPTKWNLHTKVDRISINKPDCETDYKVQPERLPLYPSIHKPRCNCEQCGSLKPLYRYVYKRISPCKCQQDSTSKCTCDNKSQNMYIQNMLKPIRLQYSIVNSPNSIRRKRDLRDIFRSRKLENKRLPRFVKQYSKSLLDIKRSYSNFENDDTPIRLHPKRKTKKAFFSSIRTPVGRIRRDIKGEYDLLEKEREDMDLTLPDIIQFMPETLRPTFKRGQCNFGCMQCKNKCNNMQNQDETYNVNDAKTTTPSKTNENMNRENYKSTGNIMGNAIPVLYKKRDTSNYKQQSDIHQSQIYIQSNPLLGKAIVLQNPCSTSHSAYQTQVPPQTTYQTEQPNLQPNLYKTTPPVALQVSKQSSYQGRFPITQQQSQPENIYQARSLSAPLQQSAAYQAPPQPPPLASPKVPTQTPSNYQYQTAPKIQPPTRYQSNSQYLNPITLQSSKQDSYKESSQLLAQTLPAQSPSLLPSQTLSTPSPQSPLQNPYTAPSPNPPQQPQQPQQPQLSQKSAPQSPPPYLQNTYQPPLKSLPQVPLTNLPKPAKQSNQPEPPQYEKQSQIVYDQLNPKYTESNGRLRLLVSALPIPDPTGTEPLLFAGDLEGPSFNAYRTYNPITADPQYYPTEHISNRDLDKIISTIVYRHPDFIDATSHDEGALVDPTPIQEEQTKGFLKKLIDGRLSPLISEPQDHIDSIFNPNYTIYPTSPASIFTSLDQIIKLFKGYLN